MDWLLAHWWQVALVAIAALAWREVAGMRGDMNEGMRLMIAFARTLERERIEREEEVKQDRADRAA